MPKNRIPSTVHNFSKITSSQLHMFVDASMAAMAAVAYLRTTTSQTSPPQACFLMGKCKVAPIKQMSVLHGTRSRCYRSAPSTTDPKRNDNDNRQKFSLVRQSGSFGLDSLK